MALVAAALFGASTPLAKMILGAGVSPWLLAGLLYLGSGGGLLAFRLATRRRGAEGEAPLRRADLPWLALVILFGGVAGPVLLMLGLSTTPASSAALLLNLEGVATMVIAWLAFRESVDRRLLAGAAAIVAGSLVLSSTGSLGAVGVGAAGGGALGWGALGWGALAIAGACLAWGVDNNLTRRLSAADPVQITLAKGLVAGVVNVALALAAGAHLPSPPAALAAGLVGLAGYGLSLVLFVLALRHLGAARTGAYFSTAPFVGAVLAVALLREPVTWQLGVAGGLMALGVWLHLTEAHAHEHTHEAMAHEHRHVHDAHHQHDHGPDDPPGEPHTHAHRHTPLTHSHAHYPDLHHRHGHGHGHAAP